MTQHTEQNNSANQTTPPVPIDPAWRVNPNSGDMRGASSALNASGVTFDNPSARQGGGSYPSPQPNTDDRNSFTPLPTNPDMYAPPRPDSPSAPWRPELQTENGWLFDFNKKGVRGRLQF